MLENENIKYSCINNIEILQFKKLLELNINHCFTLKPLNFTFKHQSKEDNQKSFDIVCKASNFNIKNLCRPDQQHTNDVKIVKDNKGINIPDFTNTDGLITNQKDTPLAITTADCIPIIVYDNNKKVIANIHSGWKGTLNQIIINATDMIIDNYSCKKEDLLYFFGPSICKDCFEVDEDVYELFLKKFGYLKDFDKIVAKKGTKYHIDTILLNKILLINYGIPHQNIVLSNICTKCNNEKIHSYRSRTDSEFGLGITIVTL